MRLPNRIRWTSSVAIAGLIFGATLIVLARQTRVPRAKGLLHQDVYVWQRHWSSAVVAAVRDAGTDFDSLLVLAAEATLRGTTCDIVKPSIDWTALSDLKRPIGLVIRIGGTSTFDLLGEAGTPRFPPVTIGQISDAVRALLATAENNHVKVDELQIDFDSPSSKLPAYDDLLDALRVEVRKPIRLTITALPSWAGSAAFARIAQRTDGFVLQLHALRVPSSPTGRVELCDIDEARRDVETFARLGVRFRVSLPTYTYEVGFDSTGRRTAVRAESTREPWPAGTTVTRLDAKAVELSNLVNAWNTDRPAALVGICWFRLPVVGDELNWSRATLTRVMHGTALTGRIELHCLPPDSAAEPIVNIVANNVGDSPATLDANQIVRIQFPTNAVSSCDALSGFVLINRQNKSLDLSQREPTILQPGETRPVAWLRISNATIDSVHAELLNRRSGDALNP